MSQNEHHLKQEESVGGTEYASVKVKTNNKGKKMKTTILAAILFVAANADAEIRPQVEPLMGYMITEEGIHIQVQTGGCTEKASFDVQTENVAGRKAFAFRRMDVDPCLAMLPYGRTITYTFDELGLREGDIVQILNPVMQVRVFERGILR